MSWLSDSVLEICVVLSLCSDPTPKEMTLPPEDAGVWDFERPKPAPQPAPPPPQIVLNAPEPKPAPPITVQPPKPEPKPEPQPEPNPDPVLLANARLLELRRLAALEQSLAPMITAQSETQNSKPESLALPTPPAQAKVLDFQGTAEQKRYQADGVDSGLPVDNTRIITEDEPIPVVLENALNSQIPGKVVLVVERDIFGSHGSLVLIPKFSRIVCSFEAADHANSSRLNMECNRILSAEKRFEIMGLSANVGSAQGQSGVTGSVDKRFWERYGTAFMLTGISTAVKVASGVIPSTTENPNLVSAATQGAEELSQKFGEITAKVLEETVSLKPIIRIAQGTRMSLSLGNDWYIAEMNTGTGEKT